jgi:hypothetical protein
MHFCVLPAFLLACPPSAVAHEFVSGIGKALFPGWRSKSDESTKASLLELGIGDGAYDNSKIVNITDSNWQELWSPQSTEEWLVEFTAHPDHCASCELIDLSFNVLPPILCCPRLTIRMLRIESLRPTSK